MKIQSRDYFDDLYKNSEDPWRIDRSWYEQRKRALVLAILPRRRFRYAFEPACGGGELTIELGRRCERILAGDFSDAAVDRALRRWQFSENSSPSGCTPCFRKMSVPEEWPRDMPGSFDLLVISEFAYYLDDDSLNRLPELISEVLAEDGVLVMCHWKHGFSQRLQTTCVVHARFRSMAGFHQGAHYEDDDFLLDLWSRDSRSVAALEGLT